jgi:hypothetical protein
VAGRGHEAMPGLSARKRLIGIRITLQKNQAQRRVEISIHAGKDMMLDMMGKIEMQKIKPSWQLQRN